MKNICKIIFIFFASMCLYGYAEEYRAIVNNYASVTQPLTLLIRIDSQAQDGSGFFVVRQIVQNEEAVELVADITTLLARFTNDQEQRIINSAGKIVTLEIQCDSYLFYTAALPDPVVLSVDPAVTPIFNIGGGDGENPITLTQQ